MNGNLCSNPFKFVSASHGNKAETKSTIAGRCRRALAIGLTTGLFAIAASASAQDVGQSLSRRADTQATCTTDPQGLMCPADASGEHVVDSPSTVVPSSISDSETVAHGLTAAQMELISNVLLGLLYFVLPVGFGLGIFLHDRYQARRSATLAAQIKLLEKLWEQSPQA